MNHVKAFIAGFLATLVFHQGLLALLRLADPNAPAPFNMIPVAPLGVPAVLSTAFWGGLWGIVLWLLIARLRGAKFWLAALVGGAVLPSVVAWFVVMPLKGMGIMGNWNPKILVGALLVNGAWGIGVAVFMRLLARGR